MYIYSRIVDIVYNITKRACTCTRRAWRETKRGGARASEASKRGGQETKGEEGGGGERKMQRQWQSHCFFHQAGLVRRAPRRENLYNHPKISWNTTISVQRQCGICPHRKTIRRLVEIQPCHSCNPKISWNTTMIRGDPHVSCTCRSHFKQSPRAPHAPGSMRSWVRCRSPPTLVGMATSSEPMSQAWRGPMPPLVLMGCSPGCSLCRMGKSLQLRGTRCTCDSWCRACCSTSDAGTGALRSTPRTRRRACVWCQSP